MLEVLPVQLIESIFRECSAPVTQLMTLIPEHLHTAALQALYPTIVAKAAIKVSPRDAMSQSTKAKAFWVVLSQQRNLQHLSIDLSAYKLPFRLACPGPLVELTALTYLKMNSPVLEFEHSMAPFNEGWQIGCLRYLRHLDLGHMGLEPEGMAFIAPQLMQLSQLQHLDLKNNSILDRGAYSLSQCLAYLTCLKHLELADNMFSCKALNELEPRLLRLSHLTYVHFGDSWSLEKGNERLQQLLLKLPALSKLCCYVPEGLENIQVWFSSFSTIESIEIHSVNIESVLQYLPRLTSMTHLSLKGERLLNVGPEGASSLQHLSALRVLDIGEIPIDDFCLENLLGSISTLTNLQGLHVQNTARRSDGFAAVVQHFKACLGLKHLSVGSEYTISVDSGDMLATALQGVTNLKRLTLDINFSAALLESTNIWRTLAQSLGSLKLLEQLQLNIVYFECNVDFQVLAPGIGSLHALEELHIDANICDEGLLAICTHLANCKRLKKLCLWISTINNEVFESLIATFQLLPELKHLELPELELNEVQLRKMMELISQRSNFEVFDSCFNDVDMERVVLQYSNECRFVGGSHNLCLLAALESEYLDNDETV